MNARLASAIASAQANVWALTGLLIILAASIFARTGSAIGAALVIGLIAWASRKLPQLTGPLKGADRGRLAWQVIILSVFITLQLLWTALGSPGMPKQPLWLHPNWVDTNLPQSRIFTWQAVIRLSATLLMTIVLAVLFRANTKDLGLSDIKPRWRWTGPLLFFLFYAGIALVSIIVGLHDKIELSRLNYSAVASAISIAFLGAGLREELLYRLLLQTRLEALLGQWNGIFIAAVIFGLIHVPGTYLNIGGFTDKVIDLAILGKAIASCILQQGVGGIIYGYIWSRFRNGWAMIILHGTLDSFSLIVLTLIRGIQLG